MACGLHLMFISSLKSSASNFDRVIILLSLNVDDAGKIDAVQLSDNGSLRVWAVFLYRNYPVCDLKDRALGYTYRNQPDCDSTPDTLSVQEELLDSTSKSRIFAEKWSSQEQSIELRTKALDAKFCVSALPKFHSPFLLYSYSQFFIWHRLQFLWISV